MSENPFLELLQRGQGHGLQTDDVLAAVLPLFRQVAAIHEEQRVAPLEGLYALTVNEEGGLALLAASLPPTQQLSGGSRKPPAAGGERAACDRARAGVTSDDQAGTEYSNLEVSDGEARAGSSRCMSRDIAPGRKWRGITTRRRTSFRSGSCWRVSRSGWISRTRKR